jgi:DUF2934 family protein
MTPDEASLHDIIAKRAYELWEERGCPIGSPHQDWDRAEKEIRHHLSLDNEAGDFTITDVRLVADEQDD